MEFSRNIFVISEFDQSHNFMFRRSHCSLFIFNNPFANANVGERTSKDHRYSHLPLQTDPGRCPSTFRTSCLLVVSCVCVCVCVSMQSGRASPLAHPTLLAAGFSRWCVDCATALTIATVHMGTSMRLVHCHALRREGVGLGGNGVATSGAQFYKTWRACHLTCR